VTIHRRIGGDLRSIGANPSKPSELPKIVEEENALCKSELNGTSKSILIPHNSHNPSLVTRANAAIQML
jgi:hypothetical protein